MAFFTLRSGGRGGSQAELNSTAETIETMRRRARHRLIGAAVLVVFGVIGFPLLFDTQPRPVAVDIPIEIPDKNKSVLPAPAAASAPEASRVVASAGSMAATPGAAKGPVSAQASLDAREQLVGSGPPAAPAAASIPVPDKPAADKKPEKKAEAPAAGDAQKKTVAAKPERPAEKPRDKAQDKPATPAASNNKPEPPAVPRDDARVARAEEEARARALLQGKSVKEAAAIAEGRFVVQVGAFSEAGLAQAARAKAERAGLRTYTQEAKTANGTWFRVRVGPFATRAEADAAAGKLKGLSLPASILTL